MEAHMESTAVADALKRFYNVRVHEDFQGLTELMSRGQGVHVIGTDDDEWIEGRDGWLSVAAQPGNMVAIEPSPGLKAFEEGDIGWAVDRPRLHLASGEVIVVRITSVFRRERGDWRIVQLHASVGERP